MEYTTSISHSDGLQYETSQIQVHRTTAKAFSPIDKYLSDEWPVSASYIAVVMPFEVISTVSLGIELPPGGSGEDNALHERLVKRQSLADCISRLGAIISTNEGREAVEQVPGPVNTTGATYSTVVLDDLLEPVNSECTNKSRRTVDTTSETESEDYGAAKARPETTNSSPIIIDEQMFDSNPDSGSEENIMAFELVIRLGLGIENDKEHQREFRIANGKVVKALGRVQVLCTFAKDQGVAVLASFYVFRTLVSEIIMGMGFLDSTETLTKHKYRLDKKIVPQHGICQVAALNNPRRRLRCTATGKSILANADTGAEMDLISLKYAQLRGLTCHKLEAGETQVQLADGSTTNLGGKVFLDIKMRTDGSSSTSVGLTRRYYSEAVKRPFYILAGLTSSLLLGEETLQELNVFEKYRESLVLESVDESFLDRPEVCTILWFDTIETFFSTSTKAPPPLSDEVADTPADTPLSQKALQRVKNLFSPKKNTLASLEDGIELSPSFEERLKERDARENYRREVADATIKKLPDGLTKARKTLQEQEKRDEYEQDKERIIHARSQSTAGNPLAGSVHIGGQRSAEVHEELPTGDEDDPDELYYA